MIRARPGRALLGGLAVPVVLRTRPGFPNRRIPSGRPARALVRTPARRHTRRMPGDTDPRAAAAYHRLIGAASPAERLEQAARLSRGVRALAWAGLRRRHPHAGEEELRWRFVALCYGRELAERTFGPRPGAPG